MRRAGPGRGALTILLAIAAPTIAERARAQTDDECNAANERAAALRRVGKLGDAGRELTTCSSSTCPDVIRASCRADLDALDKSLAAIAFDVRDAGGKEIAEVTMTVDGRLEADQPPGRPMVLDPGEHEFLFEAPGFVPIVRRFDLHSGDKGRRETVEMGPPPPRPPGSDDSRGPSTATMAQDRAPQPAAGEASAADLGWSRWNIVAVVVGGASVVALGVGSFFGVQAIRLKGDAGCPDDVCPSDGAKNKYLEAKTSATRSTGFFIAGGVLAAGGITTWVLAPTRGTRAGVRVTGDEFRLTMQGAW